MAIFFCNNKCGINDIAARCRRSDKWHIPLFCMVCRKLIIGLCNW